MYYLISNIEVNIKVLAIVVTVAIAIIFWYRSRMKRIIRHLSRMLDLAMRGEFKETSYDESEVSALEAKLNQYICASLVSEKNLSREKDRIKSLITDISHQTKTPIANILLYSQLLSEHELSREEKEFVRQIINQGEKLDFLISSLMKTSRLETGIIIVVPIKNEINQLLEHVCEQVKVKAEIKNIVIEREVVSYQAYFDYKWTEEAIYNILDNAVKYTPEKGRITIAVIEYELFCRIDITDRGIGIEKEQQAKIFGRFYRSPSVQQYEGVGIGLFLTREILASEGGYVKVSTELGKGSIFSVFLPRKEKK